MRLKVRRKTKRAGGVKCMHAGLSTKETFNLRFLHFNPKAKIKILLRAAEITWN
jgi:hypothetical protein